MAVLPGAGQGPAGGYNAGHVAGQGEACGLDAPLLTPGDQDSGLGAGIHGCHGFGPQVAESAGGGADVQDHAAAAWIGGQGIEGMAQGAGKDGQGGQGALGRQEALSVIQGGDQVAGPKAGLPVMGDCHAAEIAGLDAQQLAQLGGAHLVHHVVEGLFKFKLVVL